MKRRKRGNENGKEKQQESVFKKAVKLIDSNHYPSKHTFSALAKANKYVPHLFWQEKDSW